jgi:hypothetical protein
MKIPVLPREICLSKKDSGNLHPWRRSAMTRKESRLLDTNDPFPQMEMQLISGETLKVPEGLGEGYAVILLYRGHW